MDVKEQDDEEFIRRITRAKYDVDGLLLNEESQGLGFSNLIYVNRMIKGKDGVVNKDFVQEKNPKMPWTTSFP